MSPYVQTSWHFITAHLYALFIVTSFLTAGTMLSIISLHREGNKLSLQHIAKNLFDYENLIGRSTVVDICLYIVSKLTGRFILLLSVLVTTRIASAALAPDTDLAHNNGALISYSSYVVSGLILFIFTDLGWFLSHFIQHKFATLWAFHKVHHSATFLSPLTTYRFHPVGNAIDGFIIGAFLAIPAVAIMKIYGLDIAEILVVAGTANVVANMIVLDALHHSHFPISFGRMDYIFMSPAMHQIHHSTKTNHWGKNLGARLSIWDFVCGTGVRASGEKLFFGLGDSSEDKKFTSVLWCYFGPFFSLVGGNAASKKASPHNIEKTEIILPSMMETEPTR